jgi:hypothetical protein
LSFILAGYILSRHLINSPCFDPTIEETKAASNKEPDRGKANEYSKPWNNTYLNCNMLFDITNRMEAIAKYDNGRLWKKSFSKPAIMITNISISKGNINKTIGVIISMKAFFLSF